MRGADSAVVDPVDGGLAIAPDGEGLTLRGAESAVVDPVDGGLAIAPEGEGD